MSPLLREPGQSFSPLHALGNGEVKIKCLVVKFQQQFLLAQVGIQPCLSSVSVSFFFFFLSPKVAQNWNLPFSK